MPYTRFIFKTSYASSHTIGVWKSRSAVCTGLPWIWNFPSISISISTDFAWISMDISISMSVLYPLTAHKAQLNELISTVCYYWKYTKGKIKCLHLMKPKNVSLLNAHTCTRKYIYVVITCNYSCQHKKSKKMKQTNSLTQSHLVISQVFVLYFIFVPISSILFNSLLQLLLTDRNSQTFHPLSVLFLIPDVDQRRESQPLHYSSNCLWLNKTNSYVSREAKHGQLVWRHVLRLNCMASRINFYSKLVMWQFKFNDVKYPWIYPWGSLYPISTHGYIHGYPYPRQPWVCMTWSNSDLALILILITDVSYHHTILIPFSLSMTPSSCLS